MLPFFRKVSLKRESKILSNPTIMYVYHVLELPGLEKLFVLRIQIHLICGVSIKRKKKSIII